MAAILREPQQLFTFDPDDDYPCPRCGSADTWVTSPDRQHLLCKGCGNDITPGEWLRFALDAPFDLVIDRLGLAGIYYRIELSEKIP